MSMLFKNILSGFIEIFYSFRFPGLLLLIGLLSIQTNFSQNSDNHYFYISGISREHGLSHSQVKSIFKDSKGFMWFGTYDGLNRYDGYKCVKYLYNKQEDGAFQNKIIHSIYEDRDGNLWIGASGNDVFRYERETDSFTNFPVQISESSPVSSSHHIYEISADQTGTLWFATTNGLYQFSHELEMIIPYSAEGMPEHVDIETLSFESSGRMWVGTKGQGLYLIEDNKAKSILKGIITPFITGIILKNEKLWIATAGGGIFVYHPETGNYRQFRVKNLPEKALPNLINEMIPNGDGFYLATYGGIFIFDISKEEFYEFTSHLSFPRYPQNLGFNALYLDRQNLLWAANQSMGVYKYYLYHDDFIHIVPFPEQKEHPGNIIHSVIETGNNHFFLASEQGLILFDHKRNSFKRYTPELISSGDFMVTSILPVTEDSLLIGTWDHGLWVFHVNKEKFTKPIAYKGHNKYSQIFDLFADDEKNVWVGLHEEGLLMLDRKLNLAAHYTPDGGKHVISGISVRRITQDKSGNIWIGHLTNGIDILNKSTNKIRNIVNDYTGKSQISNNDILNFFEDSRGNIWIGTNGGGVNLYLSDEDEFVHLTEKDGLINDVIFSINEDQNGYIWLQTNRSITRLNYYGQSSSPIPQTRNFDIEDGLPNADFIFSTSLKSNDGKFLFPSSNGIIAFYPDSVVKTDVAPNIVFTQIEINNRSISEYYDKIKVFPNTKNQALIESITLNHYLNRLSFEFSALDFFKPLDNQFLVKLEGFDDDWVSIGSSRTVSYINLPHGKYSLLIKAGNSHNIWNESGLILDINIKPPWWQTWWAYFLSGIVVLGILVLIRYMAVRKERIKAKNKFELLKLEKERELDKFKLDFFTKITHEIRTPITLITTPLEKLMQKKRNYDKDEQRYFQILKSNSEKLYQLTNEILDLRKIDEGKFTIHKVTEDLIPFLKGIKERFSSFAESKNITLSFSSNYPSVYWEFDFSAIERIVSNLLSNAIKFTPSKGKVTLTCALNKEKNKPDIIVIEVSDTGKGISGKDMKEIFKPFYQTGNTNSHDTPGTGLGLALVKELADLHQGQIKATSELGKGSTFQLYFTNHLAQLNYRDNSSLVPESVNHLVPNLLPDDINKDNCKTKERILIVEDNKDLNEFMVTMLEDRYNVTSCFTGEEGFNKAMELIPDLIVSDVMMPDMNGVEMCRNLKKDPLTCHIPIVLLTALSKEENQLTGFEAGADDYISKPFNTSILLIKIRNILILKNNLRTQFAKTFLVEPKENSADTLDPLVEKTVAFIEENLDDPELNILRLQREIGIGRSQLFLKIKNITGLTVSELIQGVRLKKAYGYLSTGQYTVSETAYMVGFKNLSHFTRLFKSRFGKVPSEVLRNN
jgi:signal transduction histidine kinase/ligand-binding sensor domain-containing protein/DNA-binding response OmpR family regulator